MRAGPASVLLSSVRPALAELKIPPILASVDGVFPRVGQRGTVVTSPLKVKTFRIPPDCCEIVQTAREVLASDPFQVTATVTIASMPSPPGTIASHRRHGSRISYFDVSVFRTRGKRTHTMI